jgi:hypothetical protein
VGGVHCLELKEPRLGGARSGSALQQNCKREILEPTLVGPAETVGPDTDFPSGMTRLAVSSIPVTAVTTQYPQNPEG